MPGYDRSVTIMQQHYLQNRRQRRWIRRSRSIEVIDRKQRLIYWAKKCTIPSDSSPWMFEHDLSGSFLEVEAVFSHHPFAVEAHLFRLKNVEFRVLAVASWPHETANLGGHWWTGREIPFLGIPTPDQINQVALANLFVIAANFDQGRLDVDVIHDGDGAGVRHDHGARRRRHHHHEDRQHPGRCHTCPGHRNPARKPNARSTPQHPTYSYF